MPCGVCGPAKTSWSSPVVVIVLFAEGLDGGAYPLIPSEEYRFCLTCDAAIDLVNLAQDGNSTTKKASDWSEAVIVMSDRKKLTVKRPPPEAKC